MEDLLEFFIYIDEDLVKGLFGNLISGFIDVRTVKLIQDRTIAGKLQEGGSNGFWGEARDTHEERDGYKFKNCVDVDNTRFDKNWLNSFDASQYNRIENSITQIYGVLSFHNDLYSNLKSTNKIKDINNLNLDNNILNGDYVDLKGKILTNSYLSYLDKVINILQSYTTTKLNTLLKDNTSFLDYEVIYKLLLHLKDSLAKNNTQDMIIETQDGNKVVTTVKNDCFLNGTCSPFDKVNCNCNVFGKVLDYCKPSNSISLLRKTCSENYYEELLDDIEPFMEILRKNGITVPVKPTYRINGNSMIIIPISIYH